MNKPEIDELIELLQQESETYGDIVVKATHKKRHHENELKHWGDVRESAVNSRRELYELKMELFKFRIRLEEVDINEE